MPTLGTLYSYVGAKNLIGTTTGSFTPAVTEVILVVCAGESNATTFVAPTATGLVFTEWIFVGNASQLAPVKLWAATASAGVAYNISYGALTGTAQFHQAVVQRLTNASLAATPVTHSLTGLNGAPSDAIVTTGANSMVIWFDNDWNALAGVPAYRSGAVEIYKDQSLSGVNNCFYFAYQTAATAGSQTYGMTNPGAQNWAEGAIEILDVPANVDPGWGNYLLEDGSGVLLMEDGSKLLLDTAASAPSGVSFSGWGVPL